MASKTGIALVFIFLLMMGYLYYTRGGTLLSPSTWNRHSFGETLQIDDTGYIYLNGKKVVAVGFHVKHSPDNPTQAVAEAMLTRLQSDGVRFMVLNAAHWETDAQVTADINFWMPLLYEHHMWVFLQIQFYEPSSPIVLTVQAQLPRHQLVINTISQHPEWANMIYAYNTGWELDDISFGFTDAQVSTYLQQINPQVKTLLSNSNIGLIPIVNKPQGPTGNTWNNNRGSIPMGLYADLLGSDYYASIASSGSNTYSSAFLSGEAVLQTQYRTETNKQGFAIWHCEWGIANYNLNHELTSALFSQALNEYGYGDCASIMIWIMWGPSQWGNFAAFNADGTPTQWYLNICGLFRNQISGYLSANQILNGGSIVNVNGIMNVGSIQMQ